MDYLDNELKFANQINGEDAVRQGEGTFSMARKIATLFYRIKKIRRIQNELVAKCRECEAKLKKAKKDAAVYISKIKELEEMNRLHGGARVEMVHIDEESGLYMKRCRHLERKNARMALRMRKMIQKMQKEQEKIEEIEAQYRKQKADMIAESPSQWNAIQILKKGIEQRDNIIRNLQKNKRLNQT